MVTTLMVLAFVLGLLAGHRARVRRETRLQQERLRQLANGGIADMPEWLRALREGKR